MQHQHITRGGSGKLPPSKRRKITMTSSDAFNFNIGFIGGGNLARSIAEGILSSGECNISSLFASFTSTGEKYQKMKALGVTVFTNNKDIVLYSDVIVIAVKPHQVLSVLDELKEIFKGFTQNKSSIGTNVMPKNMRPLIVSVATAVTLKQLEEKTEVSWNMSGQSMEGHLPVVRCLPTLACSVRAGVTAYTSGRYCNEQNLKNFLTIFNTCGHSEEVPESYIDGFTSFSGSGIAFMGLVLEALSDGGVLVGLPRPMADRVAAHTMMSTAKLIIESGLSPAEVRTRVASPGGTTIHGLKVMEEKGVRGAVMDAVLRATQRAKELQPK